MTYKKHMISGSLTVAPTEALLGLAVAPDQLSDEVGKVHKAEAGTSCAIPS